MKCSPEADDQSINQSTPRSLHTDHPTVRAVFRWKWLFSLPSHYRHPTDIFGEAPGKFRYIFPNVSILPEHETERQINNKSDVSDGTSRTCIE